MIPKTSYKANSCKICFAIKMVDRDLNSAKVIAAAGLLTVSVGGKLLKGKMETSRYM